MLETMDAVQPFLGWLHEHLLSVVFVTSLIDATGVPFPGRALLVAAGIAASGQRDLVLLILSGVLGSLVGDHLLYALGMRQGTRLLALYCRLSLGSVRCVETTLAHFRRFGAMAVLICRFSTGVRLFAAVLAGAGEIGYRRFVFLDLIGSLFYMTLWIVLGATFGAAILERVGGPARALLLLGPVALLSILLYRLFRRWRYGAASRDLIRFTE
jgi:membrane protein DedA with SNARE-associated domain